MIPKGRMGWWRVSTGTNATAPMNEAREKRYREYQQRGAENGGRKRCSKQSRGLCEGGTAEQPPPTRSLRRKYNEVNYPWVGSKTKKNTLMDENVGWMGEWR